MSSAEIIVLHHVAILRYHIVEMRRDFLPASPGRTHSMIIPLVRRR